LRIGFASTSSLAIPLIKAFQADGHEIVSLISREAKRSGRGLKRKNLKIDEFANSHGIRVFHPQDASTLYDHLIETQPDMVFVISYGSLIDKELLEIPKYGWVNLHFSLLPAYRGAAPVQRAILEGEMNSGITFFKLDQGMDSGPIYLQRQFDISKGSSEEILAAMCALGASEIKNVLELLEKGIPPQPQKGNPSFAKKISKDESRIDWNCKSDAIERKIRALYPKPGAWTTLNGKRFTICSAKGAPLTGKPGLILSTKPLTVATGDLSLEIVQIHPEGSKELPSEEWIKGARLKPDSRFV
jgi:methionyl-tRNA formyltransferase